MYKGEGPKEAGRLPPYAVQKTRADNHVPSPSANSTSPNANKLPQVIGNKKICPRVKEALRKKLALARGGTSEQNKTLPFDGMEVNQKSLVPTREKGDRFQENGQLLPSHSVQTARDDNHVPNMSSKKIFPCKTCPRTFANPKSARHHARTHLTAAELEKASFFHEKCPHCQKMFFDRRAFSYHVNAHEGRRNHACPHCEKKFIRKWHLTRHLLLHQSRGEREATPSTPNT